MQKNRFTNFFLEYVFYINLIIEFYTLIIEMHRKMFFVSDFAENYQLKIFSILFQLIIYLKIIIYIDF